MRTLASSVSVLSAILWLPALSVWAGDKKSDVNEIGNRRVAHRSIISQEKEIAIGKEIASEIDHSAKVLNDPMITEYVNRVGQNIARNSDLTIPLTVKVIDSPEINAFALPGGFLYVNTGLLLAADEEDQVAGVMAHEIAHVAARHWASQMTKGTLAQLAMIPLMIIPMSYGVYYGVVEAYLNGVPPGVFEVHAQRGGGGGLPRPAVHVQGGLRPQLLCRLLLQNHRGRPPQPRKHPDRLRVASAHAGPDLEIRAGNQGNPAQARPVPCLHFGVRRHQGAAANRHQQPAETEDRERADAEEARDPDRHFHHADLLGRR